MKAPCPPPTIPILSFRFQESTTCLLKNESASADAYYDANRSLTQIH